MRAQRVEVALLVLGLAFVLAFAGVGVAVNRAALTRAEEINERNRVEQQQVIARLLQGYLAAALRALDDRAQARTWSMQPGDRQDGVALKGIHDRLARSSTAVVLTDLAGRPVGVAGDPRLVPAADDPGWAALRAGLMSSKPGVSSLMRVRDVQVVALAVPVLDVHERPVGLLVDIERMDESDLASYARELPIGQRASVVVVDARRTIVASNRIADVGRGSTGLPEIVYAAPVSGLVPIERDGIARVAVYAPVDLGGWVVVVEQDAEEFYGGLRTQGQRVELFLLALVVAGGLVVVVVNSRRQAALTLLAEGARHDPLTGLPNRQVFQQQLDAHVLRADPGAVVFCDLDDFKAVNDTYGHDTGDALLVVVAERLRAAVRPDDVVSRLGGDEFTVLLTSAPDAAHAMAVARRIELALGEPIALPDADLPGIKVSCGIAMVRRGGGEETVRAADLAMYRAKETGAGVVVAPADLSVADALPAPVRDG